METAGKVLLVSALVLGIVGLGALGLAKLGVDRVPATLSWKSDNVTVFVPIGLMLVVSIVGTIVLNVLLRRCPREVPNNAQAPNHISREVIRRTELQTRFGWVSDSTQQH